MHIQEISYHGWKRALRLSNAAIEMVVTLEVGPRVIRFALGDGENQFLEFPNEVGQSGGDAWRAYGGHRLWHAPEAAPRSYCPDNAPLRWERTPEGGVAFYQEVEAATGIAKEIHITMPDDQQRAIVTHRLTNHSAWPVELAPWAITQMALGGEAILPLPDRRSHTADLLPATSLAVWAYTDLSDARLSMGREAIRVRHAGGEAPPLKIGLYNPHGWVAYQRRGLRFTKRFTPQAGRPHPDLGCNSEVFTRFDMIELETLGPLERLAVDGSCAHTETWELTWL